MPKRFYKPLLNHSFSDHGRLAPKARNPLIERSRICGRPILLAMVHFGRQGYPAAKACLEEWRKSVCFEPDLLMELGSTCLAIAVSDPSAVASDNRLKTSLLLYGEIYGRSGEKGATGVLEHYGRYGQKAIKDIEGSYAMILADAREDKVMAITDRLSSRKIFCRAFKGGYWLSNSLSVLPMDTASLSLAGLASYLANGAMINDLTIYKDVTVLGKASVFEFCHEGLKRQEYYRHQFSKDPIKADRLAMQSELSELLIKAVRKRVEEGEIYLSLSGGYESSAILGVLAFRLKLPDIKCFSYGLDGYIAGSDACCAREMASLAGLDHFLLKSYRGDPVENVTLNAVLGEGIAHPCDEVTAWIDLGEKAGSGRSQRILFVGDNCLFYSDLSSRSYEEAIGTARIRDFSSLSWLKGAIDEDVYRALHDMLRQEVEVAIDRAALSGVGAGDSEFFFYFDQRLAHVIMPWREFFCGMRMEVRNPILDNELLDFFTRLDTRLLSGRFLYKETVRWMFPDMFRIPRASFLNSAPDWRLEFIRHRERIIETLLADHSPMDEVFPMMLVRNFINNLEDDAAGRVKATSRPRAWLSTRMPKTLVQRFKSERPLSVSSAVDPVDFLRRLLIMRTFLTYNVRSRICL